MANIQRFVQQKVNTVLYGNHYDFLTVTSSLSSQLAKTLDRDNLFHLLTKSLANQMGINQIALLLNQDDQLKLQQPVGESFSVTLDDEMCKILLDNQSPVHATHLWAHLSPATQDRWGRFRWGQLLIPMIFENQLHGILILGTRSSGDLYSDQDVQIIATVAHQGALASANVLLVEDLRGLTQDLVRSDEAKRKQVARDLHDTILQDLFFIKQRISKAQDYPELGDCIEEIIQKLRGMIKAQRPPLLDQGLVLALRGLARDMQKIAGSSPTLSWQSNLKDRLELTDEQATSIFRITQEALSNAVKHAKARNIIIKLEQISTSHLRLIVEDDGVGMTSSGIGEGLEGGQYGLVGMRERAYMIGGKLEINSSLGKGTTVVLEMRM
jgi:signal transduction histidine kinase